MARAGDVHSPRSFILVLVEKTKQNKKQIRWCEMDASEHVPSASKATPMVRIVELLLRRSHIRLQHAQGSRCCPRRKNLALRERVSTQLPVTLWDSGITVSGRDAITRICLAVTSRLVTLDTHHQLQRKVGWCFLSGGSQETSRPSTNTVEADSLTICSYA